MSFSRAPLKRFNEQVGCAPPPGSYDVVKHEDLRGAASFDRANRFRDVGAALQHVHQPPPPSTVPSTPARRTVRKTGKPVPETNTALEELQGLKTRNAYLENENARLQAVIFDLKEELKVVQGYLDVANEEIQDLRLKIQGQTEDNIAAGTKEKLARLQNELEQHRTELETTKTFLKEKEEELKSSQKTIKVMEDEWNLATQKLQECETTIHQQEVELRRLKDVLRRTEEELDERVSHLERRCVFAEEDRTKSQEDGLKRVNQLKNEISVLSEANKEELKNKIKLTHEKERLEKDLALQKELVDSLTALVEIEKEQSKKTEQLLKDEIEELLGEIVVMEEQELMQQDSFQKLQEQNAHLERQLSDARAILDSERAEVAALQNEHFAAIRELREAHTNSLSELESTKDDMDKMVQEREAAIRGLQQAQSEVSRLQAELERAGEEKKTLLSQVEGKGQSTRALENQLSASEHSRNELQSRLCEAEREGGYLQAQVAFKEEKLQALRGQVEVLTQEKVTLQWEMEELQKEIVLVQEKSSTMSENEHWKNLYEELFAKVQPFQEQLNAFAAQRDALLNENGSNQEELNKLADAYANLLGHQNQKQKIKHVMKLKDENIALKQEVSKLRSLVTQQKCDLEQLKSKLPGATRRRFDPSKAFKHDKENIQSETS